MPVARAGLRHEGLTSRTEFRTGITSREGLGRTHIFQGRVVNIDMVNWTVDVVSQFDQMVLPDIPVASPYLHPNRGDGFYAMPEVGSKAVVCWPGDSSPPFVLAFIMVHESETQVGTDDAPRGTRGRGDVNQSTTNASFAGGRPKAKPGDIVMRGRDGPFIILHRGGVLQIGSNELAQRIYVPLNNLVLDFCENYAIHNSGGSVVWGIQEGMGKDNLPTQFAQTFRVFANDKYADVRVVAGAVHQPVGEKSGGETTSLQELGIGTSEQIVYEIALAKNGFKAEDGSLLKGTTNAVKFRFFFDRVGGTFMRAEGNALISCQKKLKLHVVDDVDFRMDKNFFLDVKDDMKISVGGVIEINGSVLKVGGGDKPVARSGDLVSVSLPPGLMMTTPAGPAPLPPGVSTVGTITGGNPTFLA